MKLRNRICCILMSLLFLCAPVSAADNQIVAGEDLTPDFSAFLPEINDYLSANDFEPLTISDLEGTLGFPIYYGPNFFRAGRENPEEFQRMMDLSSLHWYQLIPLDEEIVLQVELFSRSRQAKGWEKLLPIPVLRNRIWAERHWKLSTEYGLSLVATEDSILTLLDTNGYLAQDYVVVGCGAEGSWSAEANPPAAVLLKDGVPTEVLLLEDHFFYEDKTGGPLTRAGERYPYEVAQDFYDEVSDQLNDFGSYWAIFLWPKFRYGLYAITAVILFLIFYYRRQNKAR